MDKEFLPSAQIHDLTSAVAPQSSHIHTYPFLKEAATKAWPYFQTSDFYQPPNESSPSY